MKRIWIIAFLPLLTGQLFAQKELSYADRIYEMEIKTVQLYNLRQKEGRKLPPAISFLRQNNLVLEFDDLRNEVNNYYVRIVHCNYDWTASRLRDLDYLFEYNEFTINDYAFSNNTQIPYVHYRFILPQVKISGNYLLVVYRDGNKDDLILSHRYMVADNQTSLKSDPAGMGAIALHSTNQQLNFVVNYKGVDILNPLETVHVVVRQNYRWDNARYDIKPSFVRQEISEIEYRLFDEDKFFAAGNEFRFVDFRSVNFPGQNTYRLDKNTMPIQLWIQPDRSRQGQAYAQYPDINGGYLIENLDYGDPETSGNYLLVNFVLQTPPLPSAKIYVVGQFNQWNSQENAMRYDQASSSYQHTALLKQGLYNYQYLVRSSIHPLTYFEGSHFQTENNYEVLIYYRPFQPNADLLIGFFTIPVNPR